MKKVIFAAVFAIVLVLAQAALAAEVSMPTPEQFFCDLSDVSAVACDDGVKAESVTGIWEGNSIKVTVPVQESGEGAGKATFSEAAYEPANQDQRLAGKFRAFHLTNPNDYELYLTLESCLTSPDGQAQVWANVMYARFYSDEMLKMNVPLEDGPDDDSVAFALPENFSGWLVLPQTAVNVRGMEKDDVQGVYRLSQEDEQTWNAVFTEETESAEFYQTALRFGVYMPDDEQSEVAFVIDRLFNGGEGAEIPAYSGDEQLTTPAPTQSAEPEPTAAVTPPVPTPSATKNAGKSSVHPLSFVLLGLLVAAGVVALVISARQYKQIEKKKHKKGKK